MKHFIPLTLILFSTTIIDAGKIRKAPPSLAEKLWCATIEFRWDKKFPPTEKKNKQPKYTSLRRKTRKK